VNLRMLLILTLETFVSIVAIVVAITRNSIVLLSLCTLIDTICDIIHIRVSLNEDTI